MTPDRNLLERITTLLDTLDNTCDTAPILELRDAYLAVINRYDELEDDYDDVQDSLEVAKNNIARLEGLVLFDGFPIDTKVFIHLLRHNHAFQSILQEFQQELKDIP
jgi:hypothetical protein